MLRDLRSEIVKLNLSSPLTQGSSTGASVLGSLHSRLLPLRQTNTISPLTVNSPEGLVDTAVLQATSGGVPGPSRKVSRRLFIQPAAS